MSVDADAEEVGQMTRRMGKSFVQEDTRRAVDIALGVAWPGRGVLWRSVSGCAWPSVDAGDVGSE